jgi:outer membrane autotransporter protein
MLNNKALPQRSLAQGVQSGQISNLNTRFAELRQGATGFSAGGLTLNQDGRGLPLAMLGDLFRKDPATNDEVGKDFSRWGFFATGMIERGGFDATAVRPGFDFHSASLTAGVDYRFNDSFVAGAALGYNQNNSSFDANAGKADVDGYSFTGYFSWYRGDWCVEGSLILDKLDYDLSRNIAYQIASLSGGTTTVTETAMAAPSGNQNSFSLSAGRDFNRKAWTISPYLRGVYSHLSLDGFSETMANPNAAGSGLGTSVASRSMNSMLGVAGARVSYTMSTDWGVLVPNAVVEWNHEFRNDPQTVVVRFLADPTQTPISLTDQAPDSSYFNLGLGLNAVFAQGRSAYVYYEHMAGYAGAHSNQLSLGIRIEF